MWYPPAEDIVQYSSQTVIKEGCYTPPRFHYFFQPLWAIDIEAHAQNTRKIPPSPHSAKISAFVGVPFRRYMNTAHALDALILQCIHHISLLTYAAPTTVADFTSSTITRWKSLCPIKAPNVHQNQQAYKPQLKKK
jgi:hypothetical protein